MIVLGIDPGTAVTGFGVVSDVLDSPVVPARAARVFVGAGRMRLVACGVVRTRARDPLPSRLREIHAGVAGLIARYRPDVLAVEDVFYSRNVRTTLALGHARGVVLLAGAEAGLMVREFAPAEIKKAVVGRGAATKEQVQFMLTRLLRLRAAPQPADAADGVAAAVTCLLTAHLTRLADGVDNARSARPRSVSLGGAVGLRKSVE
jgi:crossover junction endodeoxyribonuclease RuvC